LCEVLNRYYGAPTPENKTDARQRRALVLYAATLDALAAALSRGGFAPEQPFYGILCRIIARRMPWPLCKSPRE
jgi:hypothetical protein